MQIIINSLMNYITSARTLISYLITEHAIFGLHYLYSGLIAVFSGLDTQTWIVMSCPQSLLPYRRIQEIRLESELITTHFAKTHIYN